MMVINGWNLGNLRCLGLSFFRISCSGLFDLANNTTKLVVSNGLNLCWLMGNRLTVGTNGLSGSVGVGRTSVGVGRTVGLCTESLMGLLDTVAWDLLWCCIDRSGLMRMRSVHNSRLGIHGLAIGGPGLSIDGPGLSIDRLTVNWLRTIGGWSGVYNLGLLNMSRCETILSLSLCLAHLTKHANRSLLLGSTIVEATNEAEIHGL